VAQSLVIQDRYEVIRRLAIGGMGEIFLARQHTGARSSRSFSRLCILKTLRPELAEQSEALDQFLDEARVASLLNHPNIVAIYEVGVHNGVHFIAMEYIGGIDLAALLRACATQRKRLSPRVAAHVVRDAALGLDHAHHARDEAGRLLNVVHRDVSPQNLMLRADGLVKIVDFGVAQAANQMHETQGDKLKGKIRYMAPEQLLGEDLDGRCDQFSLGIVLWELLTGRPLFVGNNPIDIFQRILAGDVPLPSTVVPDVPPALEAILGRMLMQKREDRFGRCEQAADALRGWLDATGGSASSEVQQLVEDVAGAAIADRVKDLTPRAVSIQGIGGTDAGQEGPPPPPNMDASLASNAVTRPVARGSSQGAAPSLPASDEDATVVAQPRPDADEGDSLEPSDGGVLLDAAEGSGVLHGDRRFLTVLVGLLPGWSELATHIANVPMGAFGVSRLKNLFFRQLQTAAEKERGTVVRRGPDSFVIVFGLSGEPGPEDATHALSCAFAVQKLLEELAKSPGQRLRAHMGIASGLALASNVDDGPVQLAGSVVERAERLATTARQQARGVLLAGTVAELLRTSPTKLAYLSVEVAPSSSHGEQILEVTAQTPPPTVAPSGVMRKKIPIADDAEVFRRIEEEILRPFGYHFFHAKDGAQAVKLAMEERPDLILLDVQMPVMDGIQVFSLLKKTPDTKAIPIVVVTTIGRAHDEDLVRRGGADAFLTKPVKPQLLIQTVRSLLDAPVAAAP
jgi:serine/threonine-protein kinase